MNALLVLDEEQEMLATMARDLVAEKAPVAALRDLRAAGRTQDDALWAELTELGWPALALPEDHGGLGMGLAEVAVLMEALGRNLVATPLLSSLMAGMLAPDCGVAEGQVVALAWQEQVRDPDPSQVSAVVQDGKVSGTKVAVLDGSRASRFLVSTQQGLVMVSAQDAQVVPLQRIDGRDCTNLRFDDAPCQAIDARQDLASVIDAGTVALSAEMLGGMSAVLDLTVDYLKTREQFGRALGSFQALQHRVVDCFIGVELCRAAVLAAARDPSPQLTSLVKARCSDTFLHVAKEAIQLHGGIGMTDECDVGFYLKRAQVAAQTHGSAAWHRGRWATLNGY